MPINPITTSTPIDVFVIHDATPFGLSLSKPFDKLRANGSKLPVMIYGSLNKSSQRQGKPRGALTDKAVSLAKPHDTPYKLTDGNGLYLLVNPTGSKLWRFKYRIDGVKDGQAKRKEMLMTLGVYPDVALPKPVTRPADSLRWT